MKKMIAVLLSLIVLITVSLSGCSQWYVPNSMSSPPEDFEVSDVLSDADKIIQAYLDVLLDKVYIFKSYDIPDKTLNLSDFLYHLVQEQTYEIKKFTSIDMNGDGVKDVVLEVSAPVQMIKINLILLYENGTVYSTFVGDTARNMIELKKDGTFYKTFTRRWNIMRLVFSSGVFSVELVEESPDYYEFDNEFIEFIHNRDQQENAEWFPFSNETIETDLIAVWDSTLRMKCPLTFLRRQRTFYFGSDFGSGSDRG